VSAGIQPLYTLSEFAELLEKPVDTIRTWADRGSLPVVRFGTKRFVALHTIQTLYPGVWESIIACQTMADLLADDD
jgi:excisionase family DNA binding protein